MIEATPIPVLEGERVRLRGHVVADFPNLCALWADPNVIKYISGRQQSDEEVWARLLRYAGLWPLLGYGYWAVEEKASGRYLGNCGFGEFYREITPPLIGAPEAGWAIATWAHGKGYGSEAAKLMHDWADKNVKADRQVCFLEEANTPSLKIALKVGYRKAYESSYKGDAVTIFERLRRG